DRIFCGRSFLVACITPPVALFGFYESRDVRTPSRVVSCLRHDAILARLVYRFRRGSRRVRFGERALAIAAASHPNSDLRSPAGIGGASSFWRPTMRVAIQGT